MNLGDLSINLNYPIGLKFFKIIIGVGQSVTFLASVQRVYVAGGP